MAADRAINMALRVLGIGEVERDFKRVGDAGNKSFAEVKKAANGAALEVSDYTARLKRAADIARQMAANTPALNKGSATAQRTNRRDFILGAVQGEQERILKGLPDVAAAMGEGSVAARGFAGSLGAIAPYAAGASLAIGALALAARASLAAFAEHEKALSAFNASLALGGNRSIATAAQIREMASAVVDATGQTEESALQAAVSLAKIPGLTKDGLQAALDASAKLADALGTDVASVVEQQVIPVFQALAKRDMKALFDATEELNPQLRELVLSLADAGKTAEAQQALIKGLASAAGDGPGGLTEATSNLSAEWRHLKQELGEDISGPATFGINKLAGMLEWLRGKMTATSGSWQKMLGDIIMPMSPMLGTLVRGMGAFGRPARGGSGAADPDPYGTGAMIDSAASMAADARVQARWGQQDKKKGGGGRGRSGGRSVEDAAKREADQARAAADRVAEANADVVKSWQQRAAEVEAKVGLEGDALKEVERQQEVEAAVRKINTDAIEKEVEARRKAAAAAHQQFDAAAATKAATAAVEVQQSAVRDLAERYVEAERAQAEFTRRQQEARTVLEGLKTPIEKINDEIEQSIDLLRHHSLGSSDFEKRMDQLAHAMARASLEADKGKQAWIGFGDDVGRTLTDVALHGGDARDVLLELIRMPLERLLYQNVEQPIAKMIDGALGVDVDKNAAKIRAGLPSSKQVLGAYAVTDGLGAASDTTAVSVSALGTAADQAAAALASLTGTGGPNSVTGLFANDNASALPDTVAQPLTDVGQSAKDAGKAMQALVPLTGQFGGALGQALAMLSSGGGGGGGLGGVLGLAGSLLGGGISASTVARLAPSAASTIAANPALFASGTDDLPVGRPFWVGDNGRELMERTRGGQIRVHSNQQAHRMLDAGGGMTLHQTIMIPERADPRRTGSAVARGTQSGIARASRKGLASPGSR